MKKNIVYYAMLFYVISIVTASAQIDNITNLSPEWIRSGARNASVDGTDIMAYNPGGVSRLKPGFHINIGNQSFFRKPSHEYSFDYGAGMQTYNYKQDGNDLFTPNIYLSYNKNKWAVFAGVNVVSGGGEANYPKGSLNTDLIAALILATFDAFPGADYTAANTNLKASAYSVAAGIGASYLVNDKLSFGLYIRDVMAKNKTEAGLTLTGSASGTMPDLPLLLKTENTASGIGVVAGIDIKPAEKLNITVRYESKVKLDLKTKQIQDDLGFTADGEKSRRDLPAVAGLGIGYSLNEKFKILFDFNYYFQKQADWDTTYVPGDLMVEPVKTSELAGDASEYGLAFEYKVNPKFLVSLGGSYTSFNFKNQDGYYTNVGAFEVGSNDNFTINAGFAYNVTEKIRINLGFMSAVYSTQNIKALNLYPYDVNVTSKNNIMSIGLGVDFLF